MKKLVLLIFGSILLMTPIANAACSGYVVETGCRTCGNLQVWVYPQPRVFYYKETTKKVTYYTSNPDGSCKSSSAGWQSTGSCGSCGTT